MKPRIFVAFASIFFLLFVHCAETPGAVSSSLQNTPTFSPSSPQDAMTPSGKKSCRLSKTKRGLRIAGATLLGVGAASLIAGGVLLSFDGKLAGGFCEVGPLRPPCRWDTRIGGGLAMGLGSAGMLAGGIMLGYSFVPGKVDNACK